MSSTRTFLAVVSPWVALNQCPQVLSGQVFFPSVPCAPNRLQSASDDQVVFALVQVVLLKLVLQQTIFVWARTVAFECRRRG
jgi:hypothetical protein